MKAIIIQILRFIVLVLAQSLIFNKIGRFGIHPMIYPLFIMLLPFGMRPILLLLISFLMGISIDMLSDTGGLYASSLLVFALFRPIIFKAFGLRDEYEPNKEGSVLEMGHKWFFFTFGLLLLIHHSWYFFIEIFKLSEIMLVLKKVVLSVPVSYLLVILIQYIFLKRSIKK